jgi:NAD(P)-dependent dehydrogenase (short-subunit alcohol dehydrogenase family)
VGVAVLVQDKVSIISGIGPGLGQELAYVFAREGSDVVLAARTESKLRQVADEIAERWPDRRTLVCPTDISDKAQTQHLVDATMAEFGRIDCLVNSAYLPPAFTMFEDADFDDWRKGYDVTVFGTLQLTQQVVPHMKAVGKGSIVFVNSMIQKKPLPTQSGYASSKGALTAAARMLAKELGAYGIRVNSTFMGWMWGPPVEGYVEYLVSLGRSREEVIAEITKDIPLGIIPDDADCANAVAFLASDLACVITGAELDVNGGEMMV